ncbi:MAG: Thivi_2564 family membrane protein, partial [Candidatus Acidiferrales bacterium]
SHFSRHKKFEGEYRSGRNASGAAGVSACEENGDIEMPLLQLVMVLIVVGVLLWLVNRFIPMEGTIKSILNAVVVIAVVLWLLNIFGLFHSFSRIHIGA